MVPLSMDCFRFGAIALYIRDVSTIEPDIACFRTSTNLLNGLEQLFLLILRMFLTFGELNLALDMRTQTGLGILRLLLRNLTIPC